MIDVDGHLADPPGLWDRYLEPRFRDQAPRWVEDTQRRRRLLLAGSLKPAVPFPPGAALIDTTAQHDAKTRLADMDREGIDVMAMYPTVGLYFYGIERVDVTVAQCRAYNDWAHDYCSASPERLLAPLLLPQLDVHEAVLELRRGVDELGAKAAMLRPNPVGGRTLDHPAFEPLWKQLEESGAALVLHEGSTVPWLTLKRPASSTSLGIDSPGVGDSISDCETGLLATNDLASFTARLTYHCLESMLRKRMGRAARRGIRPI